MFQDAPLSISSVEDYPTLRIIRLRGPIDQTTVSEIEKFRKWVGKHPGFKKKHTLLDFKNVTRMDTAAVAEIMQAVSELKGSHHRVGVIHLTEMYRDMLRVLRVDAWLVFYGNESEALDDLKAKP
jgi:ABC-type transporter Mla MlaB component